MKTYLITGAAGFIGSHLCDRLLAEGAAVIGLDNFDPFYSPDLKRANIAEAATSPRFHMVEGDVRDAGVLEGIFTTRNIDTVIHLAARPGVRPSIAEPALYFDVNLLGTVHLLEAMRRAGVTRLVFASSSSVYGNQEKTPFSETDAVDHPISPYAASKRAGELLCATYAHLHAFSIWCLRFFTVFGPRQRPEMAIAKFLRAARDGSPITLYGDGSMRRDFTYVDDIIDGVCAAARNLDGYDIINIGGAHAYTLEELTATISAVTGRPLTITRESMPPGDVLITAADTSRGLERLGVTPRTPLAEGLARQWAWMRA